MDYLERYTRLITDGTPQRPEYMRYFSARSPKSCDVGHAMNDVSPCTPSLYATGKIDNGAPSADFVVHQSVEQMVEALVRCHLSGVASSTACTANTQRAPTGEIQGTLNFAVHNNQPYCM
jgi:hypothetical protein